jgi:hypothetical protein
MSAAGSDVVDADACEWVRAFLGGGTLPMNSPSAARAVAGPPDRRRAVAVEPSPLGCLTVLRTQGVDWQGATPIGPFPEREKCSNLAEWMIEVVDTTAARTALAAGKLTCPGCGGVLRPWGRARERTVAGIGPDQLTVSPDRARCRSCLATHVLLPADLLPGCAYRVQVVGAALLRAVRGQGRRTIAAALSIPASTVARWTHQFAANAHALRAHLTRRIVELDQECVPTVARATPSADALEALGALVAAIARRYRLARLDPWRVLALETGGRALGPSPAY